jgi:parallel beta-helix repeat protein
LNNTGGIYLSSVSNNTNIINNNVTNNSNTAISVWRSSNNNLTGNTVVNSSYGIFLGNSLDTDIIGNNASDNLYGIKLLSSSSNNITGNNLSNNDVGIDILSLSNNNIIGNNTSSNYLLGVTLGSSSNANITGNNFTNDGIIIKGNQLSHFNSHNIPIDNIVNGKPVYYHKDCSGIDIDGIPVGQVILANCSDVNVRNLQINNTAVGIEVAFSTDTNIAGNNASNNHVGIYFLHSSNNNITSNTVSNDYNGILFYSSSNNNIIGNNVSYNENGVNTSWSFYNRIYHNNIIGNANQAFDELNKNLWNDTYPSGGNYWSDYSPTCQDLFEGAMTPQTSGSPDGICDIQYDIYLDSVDYYPLATQYVDLAPPTNLSAELTGNSSGNVTISWNASLEDPVNVTNYAIYYDTDHDSYGQGYMFLTEVPASGASRYYLTIMGIGEGDPNNYFFYVQANSSKVFRFSRSDTQAAKYTRNLTAGKQLVSIPLILNNTDITSALQTVKYGIAWYYDNTDLIDPWKSHSPSKPFNDLTSVNRTMALWLVVNENCNFTVAGTVPRTTDISLKEGWNLIGYPSFIERDVSIALSTVSYERVEGYSQIPPQFLKIYNDNDIMEPGFGYWVKAGSDDVWVLTN